MDIDSSEQFLLHFHLCPKYNFATSTTSPSIISQTYVSSKK